MIVGLPASEFVVLDVETTGLEPERGHEVIEVGAQKLRGRAVIGEYVRLVKPSKPVPPESLAVHGITDSELEQGRDPAEVFPALAHFIGPSIIIAHNAAFDLGFVNAHLERLGLPILKNQAIDTLEIAQRYLILPSYRLGNVAAYLKVPQPSAHRALVDVITTREVFFKLIERAKQKV
ncbi:MAG: 3'-5' exonuclease [Candidatus Kerfeldbacteria bacterium]|nr:3'-5' exonuclease [Candidatus Kerfeldbacteria bacterium]